MASALSTPTGSAHDFVSVSEHDALQAKAGLEATFPDGAANWNKRLNAASVLIGTRRRRRSRLVERVSHLKAHANLPKVSITVLESPGSTVTEPANWSGRRCGRGHPLPGQRCRTCHEALERQRLLPAGWTGETS
jgi:hypothetical protein